MKRQRFSNQDENQAYFVFRILEVAQIMIRDEDQLQSIHPMDSENVLARLLRQTSKLAPEKLAMLLNDYYESRKSLECNE